MDAELQAIREARLAQLKAGTDRSAGNSSSNTTTSSSAVQGLLEPAAAERLSRVALVRPDRAQAVERYVQQLAAAGQLRRKVSEAEVVRILDGVAREQGKRDETRIVFERKGDVSAATPAASTAHAASDSEDDFFDE